MADMTSAAGRRYDLAIVGSGAGGFAAAIAARERDLRVVMVERGILGRTCVNVGEVRDGDARFVAGPALAVDGQRIDADHYLVATGAEPHIPDIPGLASGDYLTSTTAMDLDRLPASMLVIGGGPVAMEQAQLFARPGTEVTI